MGDKLSDFAASIEVLLGAHRRRQLVFCLSPAENRYIADHGGVGPAAKIVLRSMVKRAPDHRAGVGLSKRSIAVQPDDQMATDFRILPNGHLDARMGYLVQKFEQAMPGLFVEHVQNDRRAIELIFRLRCRALNIPDDLVVIRPVHGGGGTMANVLQAAHEGGLMGLCVTDRDTYPGDVALCRAGGTAHHAVDTLVNLNVMPRQASGFGVNDPMFGFMMTQSRTIESYIGPHLLDVFFDNQQNTREVRTRFIDAYSGFPDLRDDQFIVWMAKNLKDGGVSTDNIIAAVEAQGSHIDLTRTNLAMTAEATIPANCVGWLTEHMDGRHKKDILLAFKKDCDNETYCSAVVELFEMTWDLLAADQRMQLA